MNTLYNILMERERILCGSDLEVEKPIWIGFGMWQQDTSKVEFPGEGQTKRDQRVTDRSVKP
jgi:hypothetical protein